MPFSLVNGEQCCYVKLAMGLETANCGLARVKSGRGRGEGRTVRSQQHPRHSCVKYFVAFVCLSSRRVSLAFARSCSPLLSRFGHTDRRPLNHNSLATAKAKTTTTTITLAAIVEAALATVYWNLKWINQTSLGLNSKILIRKFSATTWRIINLPTIKKLLHIFCSLWISI